MSKHSKNWTCDPFRRARDAQEPGRQGDKAPARVSRNVAVVGLSEKQYRTSYQIARTLQRFGYKVFPVNPNLTGPVLGEEPYATVEEIPKRIDIVDVFRRSEKVMPVAKDAVTAGAKVLWLQSGVINEEAARYAEDHDLIVIMDRCIKVEHVSLVGQ